MCTVVKVGFGRWGTLKFCVGATGKNDSPFDNILSIVVLQYFFWVKSVTVAPSIYLIL